MEPFPDILLLTVVAYPLESPDCCLDILLAVSRAALIVMRSGGFSAVLNEAPIPGR
jgi:hypothetical protein